MKVSKREVRQLRAWSYKVNFAVLQLVWNLRKRSLEIKGQGTTEYAILVGVLVVIAIIAVVAFKGKIQELWDAIKDNMNTL